MFYLAANIHHCHDRVAHWVSDCHVFVIREGGITEGVLAVGLLKDATIANCFRSKQTERTIFEDWDVALWFGI